MLYHWTPEKSKIEKDGKLILQEKVKGEIVIEIVKAQERLKLIKDLNLTQVNDKIEINEEMLDRIEKMNDIARNKISSINLVIGDINITTLEELEYFDIYQLIMNEICGIILNGIPLGN
ncbi:MAG: hypothetical protein ACP5N7_01745 [Candidatus Pacearchaeota archaeon]